MLVITLALVAAFGSARQRPDLSILLGGTSGFRVAAGTVVVAETGYRWPFARSPRWYLDVRYRYTVGGVEYTGRRYSPGWRSERFTRQRDAAAALARRAPGSPIPVMYDPARPDRAVLSRSRDGWADTAVTAAFGLAAAVLGVVWLARAARRTGRRHVPTGGSTP